MEKNKESGIPNISLVEARDKLKELDTKILEILSSIFPYLEKRGEIALVVAQNKLQTRDAIYKPVQEASVLAQRRKIGEELGLDPDFIATLFNLLMQWSCSLQAKYIEKATGGEIKYESLYNQSYDDYKKNLLELCRLVAPSYDFEEHVGTAMVRSFEKGMISEMLNPLFSDRRGIIDLGCATGDIAISFSSSFEKSYGFDLSPEMISCAKVKAQNKGTAATFKVTDIEKEIPLKDNSVSLVVMNLGTASDVQYIEKVITESHRILCDNGKILFSYYNKDALVHLWPFFWDSSLAITILPERNCILVNYKGRVLPVYGKAYSIAEVEVQLGEYFLIDEVVTYPVIASIIPKQISSEKKIQLKIKRIDKSLAYSGAKEGAYIIIGGTKK